jgi:hypothetical protein
MTNKGPNKGPLAAYCPSQLVSQETKIAGTQKLRHNLTRALKGVVQAPLKERERVYVWDVPEWEWKAPSVESARYSAGAAPPPSAVASNASNSSDDSSRNLPRDK